LPWQVDVPWVPSLSVSLAFRIDGLSAQMLALITGIGAWIFVYASGYLVHEPRRGRLFVVLLLFMLAMIGAVSADNVILLFLFWELTSLTSFLLVGFNHADVHARAAARQALLGRFMPPFQPRMPPPFQPPPIPPPIPPPMGGNQILPLPPRPAMAGAVVITVAAASSKAASRPKPNLFMF
jgi:hypothetical protein